MGPNNLPDPRSVRKGMAIALIIALVAASVITLPAIIILGSGKLSVGVSSPNRPAAEVSPTRGSLANLTASTNTPEPTPTLVPAWQGTSRMNILLLGIDQRPNQNPDRTRTDTMIVLSLDPARHAAGMLSIPRDLYVTLPNHMRDRINAAHVFGGPSMAMHAVESTFGIPIQHYVRVNFTALTRLVDLVGGIDVYVDQDINDPTYPSMNYGYDPFVISKGWHHMDGATALKYARTRHGSSDFFRMRRQQQIIMALRDRVLSTDAIPKLLPNLPQIMSTLRDAVSTDMSFTEMARLLVYAKDLPADRITRVVVSEDDAQHIRTSAGAAVLVPYPGRMRLLASQLYSLPPTDEIVGVQNGTQIKDLAATTQVYLHGLGYSAFQAGDSRGDYAHSVILDFRGDSAFAHRLATALNLPESAITTTYGVNVRFDVMVILGDDYHPQ